MQAREPERRPDSEKKGAQHLTPKGCTPRRGEAVGLQPKGLHPKGVYQPGGLNKPEACTP